MGLMIFKRGDDYREYKKAVNMAKEAIDTICELTEDMEEEYGYNKRYGHRDEMEMDERRGRDSMGRYR